jgi:excisionase family DNA binding protein
MESGDFMTVEEISTYLRVPPSTVYKLAREGKLPGFKVGRHWRFRRDAVVQWIQNLEQNLVSTVMPHDPMKL